ncbi:MAG: hypothetical protein ACTSR8_02510 [Promethearchaeota archaeon]
MNGLTLEAKRIKIYEKDDIQMEVKAPKPKSFEGDETDAQKRLTEMLGALDWKVKSTQYPEGEKYGIATIEHSQYPIKH